MSLAEEKDYVLTHIKKSRAIDLYEDLPLLGESSLFRQLYSEHEVELLHREYVDVHPSRSEEGADEMVLTLTPAGEVFINNGGYSLPEQKELKEERRKQLEWNWRRGFESISTVGSIIAIAISVLTFLNTPKNSDLEKLQSQIDSLKRVMPAVTITPPISSTSTKNKP